MHPFAFSAAVQEIHDAHGLSEVAHQAGTMGYTSLVVPDHLIARLSPVPAMTAIAMATERSRGGTFVLNNDLHRSPHLYIGTILGELAPLVERLAGE